MGLAYIVEGNARWLEMQGIWKTVEEDIDDSPLCILWVVCNRAIK